MIELSYFFGFACLFVACIRILHMNSRAEWPELFANGTSINWGFPSADSGTTADSKQSDEGFVTQILKHAPLFSKPYIPPLIWGRSGHLQTIIHSTLSRHKAPREKGDSRHAILLSDGTTVTFDLFLPPSELNKNLQSLQKDVTLVVCPGIGNSSETVALRTFSHNANQSGFRVAVLNHLGVIPTIPLTTSRIFAYGSTEEYGAMVDEVISMYPHTTLIAVGFSMGGNLVCKYLGESQANRDKIIAGISCCQGYDIMRLYGLLHTWKHMGIGYLRAINVCVQKVLHNFQDILLSEDNLTQYGIEDRDDVLKSRSLLKVDDILLSKIAGYKTTEDYYRASSSSLYIPNINIPMLFINSKDDPIVPCEMFDIPRLHTAVNEKALFVVTKHGGHLGFYECQEGSRFFHRGTFTWLDKAIIEYVKALLAVTATVAAASGSIMEDPEDPGVSVKRKSSKERDNRFVTIGDRQIMNENVPVELSVPTNGSKPDVSAGTRLSEKVLSVTEVFSDDEDEGEDLSLKASMLRRRKGSSQTLQDGDEDLISASSKLMLSA